MNPKHRQIIDEIMAGGRVMPPLAERKRIRDVHLNASEHTTTPIAGQTTTVESDRGYSNPNNGWSGD